MSRRNKKHLRQKAPALSHDEQEAREKETILRQTIGSLICPTHAAQEPAAFIAHRYDNLQADNRFCALAIELWRNRPGVGADLAAALTDLEAESRRHLEALVPLRRRLMAIAAQTAAGPHDDHLDANAIDPATVAKALWEDFEMIPE